MMYRTRKTRKGWVAEYRPIGALKLWRRVRLHGYALAFETRDKAEFLVMLHRGDFSW